jgi:hypothetical protein
MALPLPPTSISNGAFLTTKENASELDANCRRPSSSSGEKSFRATAGGCNGGTTAVDEGTTTSSSFTMPAKRAASSMTTEDWFSSCVGHYPT